MPDISVCKQTFYGGLENKYEYRYKRTVTYKTFENITENDWLERS